MSDTKEQPTGPTEMYLCEINHLILHSDQPYIFRKHPGCYECNKYLAHGTPAEHNPARAPHNKFASLWCDTCPRPTSGTPAGVLLEKLDKALNKLHFMDSQGDGPLVYRKEVRKMIRKTLKAAAPATTNVRETFEKWYAAYKDITLYIDGMQDAFEAGYNARSNERDAQAAAPGPKCSHGVLMREFCQGCEDYGVPSAGAASHPLQDKPPAAPLCGKRIPETGLGCTLEPGHQGRHDVDVTKVSETPTPLAAAPSGKEPAPDWCDVCNASQMVIEDGEHVCGLTTYEAYSLGWRRGNNASHPLQDKPPAAPLTAAAGNVLDHWEQLPNDLRGDVGFENLESALQKLYQVVAAQDKPPGPRCSHGVLMREFCQGCEDAP